MKISGSLMRHVRHFGLFLVTLGIWNLADIINPEKTIILLCIWSVMQSYIIVYLENKLNKRK
jgi:uncharacterized membrane protein